MKASRPAQEIISSDDAVMTALLIHLLRIAVFTKPAAWPAAALHTSKDLHAHFRRELTPFTSRIPAVMANLSDLPPEELGIRHFAAYLLEKIEVLAGALGRYEPAGLRVKGASHLQEALGQGRGAVLWCENSHSSSLLLKAAISGAGFQVHHLSRPGHNLSNTRYGMRFLNPIVRKAEDHYIAERIFVDDTNTLPVSRHIMELLKANAIVSVTVNSQGSQAVEAPMLDGVLRVATGAPHFAIRSGAPLLPVLSYRDGDAYVVEIGQRIDLDGRHREEAYEIAVQELARRVDAFARSHPLDWSGWLRGAYAEAPGPDAAG